jgi:ribosomal-protein-alanine N-acetyltransferase
MTKAVRLSADMLKGAALLEAECFGEPWSEKSLELLLGERGVGFAVLLNGEVVAYGGMLTVLDEGQITNIAVSSAHRRKGYASAVLASLEEYAEHNGIALLSLEVRESNLAARSLYTREGWSEVGRRRNFYKLPTEDAIIMTKALKEE